MPHEGIEAIAPPKAVGCRTVNPVGQVGQQVSPLILGTAERRWAARDGARQAVHASPLNRKNVDGSCLGRKRRWLYRTRCGHGTPLAFLSRPGDIQPRGCTGRFHVVASFKVECGVATGQWRRLCVRMMMMIYGGIPRGGSIRQRGLRGPVKKSIRVVDRIRVRCRGKRGFKRMSLIFDDGLRYYWVGTAASTSGLTRRVSVLPSMVSTPLEMRGLQNVSYYYS
jgi:hypothetical protein